MLGDLLFSFLAVDCEGSALIQLIMSGIQDIRLKLYDCVNSSNDLVW